MAYRYGFKSEAEQTSAETREDLGLRLVDRLNVFTLAEYLDIPVWTLSSLPSRAQSTPGLQDAVSLLSGVEQTALSAFTVFNGPRRVIVHNDTHGEARQASNVAHEAAHGLLLHPAAPVLDRRGCRLWNEDVEDEASYLAGALLVPRAAAWWLVKRKMSFEEAAHHFGCSVEMIRWRVNLTGARKRLAS
ncbi:ImmA/IrrE family metallo-endopeptidase [Spirillospora sp. NPDC047418]